VASPRATSLRSLPLARRSASASGRSREAGSFCVSQRVTGAVSRISTKRRSSARAVRRRNPRRSSRMTMPEAVLWPRPIRRLSSVKESPRPDARSSSTSSSRASSCGGVSGSGRLRASAEIESRRRRLIVSRSAAIRAAASTTGSGPVLTGVAAPSGVGTESGAGPAAGRRDTPVGTPPAGVAPRPEPSGGARG
jgi:hypothetical protein